MSENSIVTISLVPRERFSHTLKTLESIYETTTIPIKLICVDGYFPDEIRSSLNEKASELGFTLISKDYPLTPNEARNIVIQNTDTPYIVFIDNDVITYPGWIEYLLEAAETHNADLVTPTILIGKPGREKVHHAGGTLKIETIDGKRRFVTSHHYGNAPLEETLAEVESGPTQAIEFHCALARTEIFNKIGLLDEELMSAEEHYDLCLDIQKIGGLIYYESRSLVTYVTSPPFTSEDIAFYLLRWSDAWNQKTVNHCWNKWGLQEDDPRRDRIQAFLTRHREFIYPIISPKFGKIIRKLKHIIPFSPAILLANLIENRITRDVRKARNKYEQEFHSS